MTDDQAWDAVGLLDPLVDTPNLDLLAASGARFENAFVSTSICPASRASILTGLYFPAHGYTFDQPPLTTADLAVTWPALLRASGYRVALIGKNGLGLDDPALDQLFDEWETYPREYFLDDGGREVHLTDLLAEKASGFVARQDADQPFALIVWFHAPHAVGGFAAEPFVPPRRYESLYDGIVFPRRPGSSPEQWFDRPGFFDRGLNRQRRDLWWSDGRYQHNSRRYHAMVRGVDDAVGAVMSSLAKHGLAGDTVMIFTSDNGFYRGERLFGGKWLGHDPSSRVPLYVRLAPSKPRVFDELVVNVDLAPTILELAGEAAPSAMQGRSLVPLMVDEEASWREDLFLEHSYSPAGMPGIPRFFGVRSELWKYLYFPDHGYEELFDLRSDPAELRDLAGDPDFEEVRRELRRRAEELRFELGGDIFQDGFEAGDTSSWTTVVPRP